MLSPFLLIFLRHCSILLLELFKYLLEVLTPSFINRRLHRNQALAHSPFKQHRFEFPTGKILSVHLLVFLLNDILDDEKSQAIALELYVYLLVLAYLFDF